MQKHTAKLVWPIVICALGALIWWRGAGDGAGVGDIADLGLGEAQTYEEEGEFAFSFPQKLKTTEVPIEGVENGKIILAESSEAGKGFEVVVLPFDEDIVLTKERILQDLPEMKIENEKETKIGNIKALVFESEDENIGPTYEIWFVNKGYIYEARTYKDFGPSMQEILKTWEFK